MKFAVSKGEKDVADITTRLFDIKGTGAAEKAKRTQAALLAANPHLSDLTNVPEGTLIVIPDLPESPSVKVTQTTNVGTELHDQLKLALTELSEAIGRSAESESQAAATTNELLKNRDLKDFAAQSPELRERLAKITEGVKSQVKETKARATAEKEAVAQLQAALGKLNL